MIGGGRIAVLEILRSNIRTKESILKGESEGKTFYDILTAGEAFGMQTFDKDILSRFEQGLITLETALAYASKRNVVNRGIDTIKSRRGEKTTDIEGLGMDKNYEDKIFR